MGTHAIRHSHTQGPDVTQVRHVDITEPLEWLGKGIRTLAKSPLHGLAYGALFAAACWVTLWLTWSLPWFSIAFLTGLMLLGPFLAAGLYVAARQQEVGASVSIRQSLELIWDRRTNLSLFVLFLGLIAAAWVRLSALLFAIQFNTLSPSLDRDQSLLTLQGFDPLTAAFFLGIGLILAATVFITSAVAIPMILDRDAGPITAIQASARAFKENWPAMLLWAALIVALSGIGILTFFVGMIVVFPVLGYATWHSYRRMLA
ncbi:DUF2189 domain-containing protein [Thiocystis violacea]|uniref:DUF2189 domain-containing protein n=1 Tax=Thiocystis violacea TaxID=13725 RepID=UPI001906A554|nr:DUF2189 domain-containing protein [Thiocystis violacea]MBK1721996.1 hypothetical protein [Thiocystis violacea]